MQHEEMLMQSLKHHFGLPMMHAQTSTICIHHWCICPPTSRQGSQGDAALPISISNRSQGFMQPAALTLH
jgi:hypothetical protein